MDRNKIKLLKEKVRKTDNKKEYNRIATVCITGKKKKQDGNLIVNKSKGNKEEKALS